MKTMDQWQTCVWLPGVETKREWSEMGILEFRIVTTTCVVETRFLEKSEQNNNALLHESIGRISIDY